VEDLIITKQTSRKKHLEDAQAPGRLPQQVRSGIEMAARDERDLVELAKLGATARR